MKRLSATLFGLSLCLTALPCAAQLGRSYAPRPVEPPQRKPELSLGDRIGAAAATRQLDSKELDERVAALTRMGRTGGTRGVDQLVQLLDRENGLKTAEERLTAVRELARHTDVPKARLSLLRVLGGLSDEGKSQLDESARQAAALALAKSGRHDSLSTLAKILRQDSFGAAATAQALVAFPPRDLSVITDGRGAASDYFIRALGELGDQRGFFPLREIVRRGSVEQRTLAAEQLTKLGALETVALAQQWLKKSKDLGKGRHTVDSDLKLASAARILTWTRSTGYLEAIQLLLEGDDWTQGVELALLAAHPKLVPALEKRLKQTDGDARSQIIAAIGAAGGERAARLLAERLAAAEDAAAAALAFARGNDDESEAALGALLGKPETRTLAARAAALRKSLGGGAPSGLHGVLLELLGSKQPNDRAAAAFGLALESDAQAIELIRRKDSVVVAAAARTALGRPDVLSAAAARLATEQRRTLKAALAVALLDPDAAKQVPTSVLLELVQGGSAAMFVAAYALAARDQPELRPEVERWLASGNPELRSSVALGLGRAAHPRALGLLETAYRFETNSDVRLALVLGAGSRSEPTRSRLLSLAADLDADAAVRGAARRVLRRPTSPRASGRSVAWLELVGGGGVLRVGTDLLPALPAAPDPDGQCPMAHLPEGSIRLAAVPSGVVPSP
ncbi:MAG: HEAT repeat domain-containing protein [Polyangiaceae bacterium]